MPVKDQTLLRRLRRMRVLVIHPDDAELEMVLAHLKRVGCQVDSVWPAPESLLQHVDMVLFLVSNVSDKKSLLWMSGSETIARIAIISFETPEILGELERLHVHGILSKPIRIFGILAALTTAMGLARHESTLKQRIVSLDDTLKARRKIEQAVEILARTRNISSEEAYKRLRDKSQNDKMKIADIAQAIIASNDI